MDVTPHPLLAVLHAAAAGEFPPADGRALFLPPLPNRQAAVVSLTGRVYLATDHRPPGLDGFGSALHPAVLQQLAGPDGEIVTLATHGQGGGTLPARHDLADHPRVSPNTTTRTSAPASEGMSRVAGRCHASVPDEP